MLQQRLILGLWTPGGRIGTRGGGRRHRRRLLEGSLQLPRHELLLQAQELLLQRPRPGV